MKVSFNGLRKNIAYDFNLVVERIKYLELDQDLGSEINRLKTSLDCLLACYDDEVEGDFDSLSETINLEEISI